MLRFLLSFLLLAAGPAWAQYTCNYEGSQREMNACAIRDYKAADRELNRTYRSTLARLPKAKRQPLVVEQRRWVKRRDTLCASRKNAPGTNVTIDYLTCLQTFTELRTLQLRML